MEEKKQYKKKGYLNTNFQFFHIKDETEQTFDYHFHEFDKIVFFYSGNVTYLIEGKSYRLEPGDMLLVHHHDIHKPVITKGSVYERVVFYIRPEFIKMYHDEKQDLSKCFQITRKKKHHLIRLEKQARERMTRIVEELEEAILGDEFAKDLYSNTLFTQFMIHLNRLVINDQVEDSNTSVVYDKKMEQLLSYINENLKNELSVEHLANLSYYSKYYLMHKFKDVTGYTLYNYIQKKRLLLASELIRQGMPVTKAAYECGFQDYSTFLRAFKKMFHMSPSDIH